MNCSSYHPKRLPSERQLRFVAWGRGAWRHREHAEELGPAQPITTLRMVAGDTRRSLKLSSTLASANILEHSKTFFQKVLKTRKYYVFKTRKRRCGAWRHREHAEELGPTLDHGDAAHGRGGYEAQLQARLLDHGVALRHEAPSVESFFAKCVSSWRGKLVPRKRNRPNLCAQYSVHNPCVLRLPPVVHHTELEETRCGVGGTAAGARTRTARD